MAIFDGQLQFSGTPGIPNSTDSPTTGTQVSTNTIDMGATVDWGIGDDPAPKLSAQVTTAFTGGTSLQVNIQGSVDNSTFVTLAAGPTVLEANLLVGTHLFDIDLPRLAGATPDRAGGTMGRPRYLRLQYVSVGTHGAGALFAGLVLDRTDMLTVYPTSWSGLWPAGV